MNKFVEIKTLFFDDEDDYYEQYVVYTSPFDYRYTLLRFKKTGTWYVGDLNNDGVGLIPDVIQDDLNLFLRIIVLNITYIFMNYACVE